MMETIHDISGSSINTHMAEVRDELQASLKHALSRSTANGMSLRILQGEHSLWLVARWPSMGGVAFRLGYDAYGPISVTTRAQYEDRTEYEVKVSYGILRVQVELLDADHPLMHWRVSIIPNGGFHMPTWPRDVYPFDESTNPLGAEGMVHTSQRGPATGQLYLSLTRPQSGSLLYIQDFTALNDYFAKTRSAPINSVSGRWPDMGYRPPVSNGFPLYAGEEVVLSDAYARFTQEIPQGNEKSALLYFNMLADIYRHLPRPQTTYRHWPDRAEQTIRDLSESPDCTATREGHRFLNAYVSTGYEMPESMVQLAVLLPTLDYADWAEREIALAKDIEAGLGIFYDSRIASYLRLPDGSLREEYQNDYKDPWEVDSWYLYHPLANLAKLAARGNESARGLFLNSLDYAINAAHHFNYQWPVSFRADTFEVMKNLDRPPRSGETDVPALYAYVMIQAWEMTHEERYLEEAKRAADTLRGISFAIGYQYNNTAWGAVAMMRLWKETGNPFYLDLSYICLGSIFQNTFLWECDYGFAADYHTFFGVTPLHDASYLAIFEEYEIYAAFHEYLTVGQEDVPESIRLMLAEFCRYTLDRAWCYYPSELPAEILAHEQREGEIIRELAIPLEDIYQGWEKPGQVGQEIYGAGAAMTFAVRAYHHINGAPFIIYCDYPITNPQGGEAEGNLSFRVQGDGLYKCRIRLIPRGDDPLPQVTLRATKGDHDDPLEGDPTSEGHLEFTVSGQTQVTIEWKGKN